MSILFNRDPNEPVSQFHLLIMSCLIVLIMVGYPTTILALAAFNSDVPSEKPKANRYFTDYKNRYAFVVGISHYNDDSGYSSVEGSIHDAKAIANILEERYGFHVRLLIDNDQQHITNTVLVEALDNFKEQIQQASDSLFVFYYAGHGVKNAIVSADGSELKFTVLAKKIAAYKTHHTLLILDACSSGTIFDSEEVSKTFQENLNNNLDYKLISGEGGALEWAFAHPTVQAITAGTGKEKVKDQVKFSAKYSQMRSEEAESLKQYSPFTAMLKQALEGRIGLDQQSENIPTGTIPGSMLGYQLSQLVAANSQQLKEIDQVPHSRTLAGQGDILLIPSRCDVLNPHIVGLLYLLDDRYQLPRASAIKALLSEKEQTNQELVREALPHLAYALSADTPQVKEAALDALNKLVNKNGPLKDFRPIISSLTKILNTAKTAVLSKKAAALLGKLAKFSDIDAIAAMEKYITVQLLKKWTGLLDNTGLADEQPDVVKHKEKLAKLAKQKLNVAENMAHLERRRQAAQWLLDYGVETILDNISLQSFKNVNDLDATIKSEQKKIDGLEKSIVHTSSELEGTQGQLKRLLTKLKSLWEQYVDIRYDYQHKQAEHRTFERRYNHIDGELNKLLESLPKIEDHLRGEARKIEDAIKLYLKQKWAQASKKKHLLDRLSPVWQDVDKLLQKVVQFTERQTQQMCYKLNKANSEHLLSEYLLSQLLPDFLKDWFKLEVKLETTDFLYQLARQFLEEELQDGKPLRKQLENFCGGKQTEIDWQKLYEKFVDWRNLLVEIEAVRKTQKALSPKVKNLEGEVVFLEKDIVAERQAKAEAEKVLNDSKIETTRLEQNVDDTENRLKTIKEKISKAQKGLDDLEAQKAEQQKLLGVSKERLERLKKARQYLCRQRQGKDCPQFASPPLK